MSLPASVSKVPVEGFYPNADGTPAEGSVTFTLTVPSLNYPGSDTTVWGSTIPARIDSDGKFSVELAANDDPDAGPKGSAYLVVEHLRGRAPNRWIMVLSKDDAPMINIAGFERVEGAPSATSATYYSAAVKLAEHVAADDPHLDRAHAIDILSAHTGAVDPHNDRAYADAIYDDADNRLSDLELAPPAHAHPIAGVTDLQHGG